ncbi:MAG: peptide-methionine (S)-S-oxide reductase MsrA [Candidatus Sericytochromatia bacterium]|nr:peptide-methionine (S)-S-oxide reductase MsrA [Candidatus Tanganyikabacteria bacterium]
MGKLLRRLGLALLACLFVVPAAWAKAEPAEVATLGGGCFWCIEAIYQELRGVRKVESGYSGGAAANPSYEEVGSGKSGHAEVVQITFDPRSVTYRDLLEVFFTVHDPTTPDRQGADVGPQYRSVVFYHSPAQKAVAEAVMSEIARQRVWKDPLVTELVPFKAFYKAEVYHQQYYARNPNQPYCAIVIAPKVAKFRRKFLSRLKAGKS